MVVDYENSDLNDGVASEDGNMASDEYESGNFSSGDEFPPPNVRSISEGITQNDIEMAFEQTQRSSRNASPLPPLASKPQANDDDIFEKVAPGLSSSRLDELLGQPMSDSSSGAPSRRQHRRTHSAPVIPRPHPLGGPSGPVRKDSVDSTGSRGNRERANSRGSLVRIESFGEIQQHQPSLLDQARGRSASSSKESRHRRVSSVSGVMGSGRHRRVASGSARPPTGRPPSISRSNSNNSETPPVPVPQQVVTAPASTPELGGALSLDDIEQSFDTISNNAFLEAMRKSYQ